MVQQAARPSSCRQVVPRKDCEVEELLALQPCWKDGAGGVDLVVVADDEANTFLPMKDGWKLDGVNRPRVVVVQPSEVLKHGDCDYEDCSCVPAIVHAHAEKERGPYEDACDEEKVPRQELHRRHFQEDLLPWTWEDRKDDEE